MFNSSFSVLPLSQTQFDLPGRPVVSSNNPLARPTIQFLNIAFPRKRSRRIGLQGREGAKVDPGGGLV